jgi:hypothetical protein
MRPAPTIDDDARQIIASCGLSSVHKIALRGWLLVVPPRGHGPNAGHGGAAATQTPARGTTEGEQQVLLGGMGAILGVIRRGNAYLFA